MDDLISRQAAIYLPVIPKAERDYISFNLDDVYEQGWNECQNHIEQMPSAEPKTGRDCTDFVRWLMDEVMDEENWQMNAVANGEIICRKLKKLGMLDVVDGYYVKTRETGEWIRRDEVRNVYGDTYVECSECGEKYVVQHIEDEKYCRNCGAKMEVEE